MAKYQQYAEYKDSGVEWLDVVPHHWEAIKLDYVINSIGDIDHYMPNSIDTGIPYVMTGDLQDLVSKINFENCKQVTYGDYLKLSRKIKASKGDVILARYATIGTLSYVDIDSDFLVSYSCVIIKPHIKRTSGRYLFFYLKSQAFLQAIRIYINSNTQGNVGIDSLRNVKIIIPPVSEQTQIANFLDHETAQIDTLIEKQQTLIQLLKEKRQAVISHAVTKGLNPDAPMKDSGVEWLGEVPEHWVVMQFRRITSLSQGLQIPQSERIHEPSKNNVEYITIKSIHAGDTLEHREYINKPSLRVQCDYDDVLLARTGATGEVITGVKGAFHNNFFKIDYSEKIDKNFLVNMLKVQELKSHLLMLAGTTTIPDLNHGAFLSTAIALPSLEEQEEICSEISRLSEKYNLLLEVAIKQVKLLQERRTALISAAVTGKIDVRGWRAPE